MAQSLVEARCSGESFIKQVEVLQSEKAALEVLKEQAEDHSAALAKENKALQEKYALSRTICKVTK